MGLLDKLGKKLGDAMEKTLAKNMTGASKEEYEKNKAEREAAAAEKLANAVQPISGKYEKSELDNLGALLKKIGAIGDDELWIAGFLNLRANTNATVANLFTGKKNLKFLTCNGDKFYCLSLDDGEISSYRHFRKDDVLLVEVKGLMTKSFAVTFRDKGMYSVDVTENKGKIDEMKAKLK